LKELNVEEQKRVMDALDVIMVTYGEQPFSKIFSTLEGFLSSKDIPGGGGVILNEIVTTVNQALEVAFTEVGKEMGRLADNPEELITRMTKLRDEELEKAMHSES
jgi:hypothetical protein